MEDYIYKLNNAKTQKEKFLTDITLQVRYPLIDHVRITEEQIKEFSKVYPNFINERTVCVIEPYNGRMNKIEMLISICRAYKYSFTIFGLGVHSPGNCFTIIVSEEPKIPNSP